MTLHAWIITMRGRIREALVPELRVLREGNRLLRAEVEEALSVANYWHAIAQEGIKRANVNGRDACRGRWMLDRMRHQKCGRNAGWTLDGLYLGDDAAAAIDVAMEEESKHE